MTLLRCIPFVLAAAVSPSPARAQPDSDPIKVRTVAEELERERAFDAARRQVDLWRHNAGGWEARGRECTLWEREGLLELALLCFEEIARHCRRDELAAQAGFHVARLRFDPRTPNRDPERARTEATDVVVRWPHTDGARRALAWLRGEARARAQEADTLLGVASQVVAADAAGAREILAECWVEAARLRLASGDPRLELSAEHLLARGREAARGTVWWDDAAILSARAYRAVGKTEQALQWYEQVASLHASSWWVGSYDSPFLDDAFMEMGELLEAMNRPREAADAYQRLLDTLPHSRMRDDAAYRWALLQRDGGEALREFVRAYPESRHREAARAAGEGAP